MNPIAKRLMRAANALAVGVYRRSGGRIGGTARGTRLLLLTVRGRATGTPHTVAVTYFEHEGGYLVVGSGGGTKDEPQWMKNLRAAPTAHVEFGREHCDATVRVADPAERGELWNTVILPRAPFFAGYEKKSGRVIPVAVLTPVSV